MSWSIYATGTVEGVKKVVEESKQTYDSPANTKQFEAAKAFILAELETWPQLAELVPGKKTGLDLKASGHHDGTNPGTLSITLTPITFRV